MSYESQQRDETIRVSDGMPSRRGKLSFDFTFDPNLKTITINDTDFISFILIVNDTRGEILYNPAFPSTSGNITANVLQLNASTSGMSAADQLHVLYEADELNSVVLGDIEDELIDQGLTLDSTLAELLAQGIVQDSQLAELLDQGVTLDSTLTELLAQGVVQDSELAELLAQGVVQDAELAESLAQGVTLDNILNESLGQGQTLDQSENWQDNILSELQKQTKLLTKIYQ